MSLGPVCPDAKRRCAAINPRDVFQILKAFELAFQAAGKMGDLRLRHCAGRMLLARMQVATPPASPAEQATVADAIATAERAVLEAIAKVKATAAHEELCSNTLIWRMDR